MLSDAKVEIGYLTDAVVMGGCSYIPKIRILSRVFVKEKSITKV